MAKLFYSYSHRDEADREELEVHMSLLTRQGFIEAWHDRRIVPGDEFAGVIGAELEQADIILLLVSPYFLASSYCYDVEMKRAMERHERHEARVIPVILQPCDWHQAPFGRLLAFPKDGKPVSKYPNKHDAFLEVVQAVRQALATSPRADTASAPTAGPPTRRAEDRSSDLRIQKSSREQDQKVRKTTVDPIDYTESFKENVAGTLKARFRLDANGEPQYERDPNDRRLRVYAIAIFLETARAMQIKKVSYFMDHPTFVDAKGYSDDADNKFTEEIDSYGDVEIEVTVKMVDGHEYKQRAWLSHMLKNGHAGNMTSAVRAALKRITRN